MTDGPYNESIRGPGNRGLGGIWALLNSIAGGLGSLPQIAADIAIIRAHIAGDGTGTTLRERVSYLTGVAAPSQQAFGVSLPAYVASVFGSRGIAIATAKTMHGELVENQQYIYQILSALTNQVLDAGEPMPRQVRDAVLQLASSLGNASTSTPNFTALAWLALIANSTERSADCCEEGSAPPAPTNNPPPAGFCVPANAVRQVSWNQVGTQLVNGVVNNVWRPVFDFSNGVNAPLAGTGALGPEPTAPALRFVGGVDITFCLSWNFVDNTTPTAFGRYFGITQATAEGNQDLSGPLNSPSTLAVGGLSDDRNLCDGIERYGAHNFAFPVGVTPSLNVFLGLTQSRGCAQ